MKINLGFSSITLGVLIWVGGLIYMLEVTVYFQNADGVDVAEDSYIVLNPYLSDYSELKPNYSWKMPDNSYHLIEHLTDDIDITQNRIEITSITFSE